MARIIPENAVTIPGQATKVFTGQLFDVYQWPQKMYNGSTATFEMLRRPDTVLFIAIQDGKILFVVDEQPNRGAVVHLPGGRVDPGESWEQAAQRECREELGLTFSQWRLVQVVQPLQKMEWFVAVYLATDVVDQQAPQLGPGERIQSRPLSLAETRAEVAANMSEQYLRPLFDACASLDDLLEIPEYTGREIA